MCITMYYICYIKTTNNMKTSEFKIGQTVKANFNGKKYLVVIRDIFTDCIGVEAKWCAPFGKTITKDNSELAKVSVFFTHELEIF